MGLWWGKHYGSENSVVKDSHRKKELGTCLLIYLKGLPKDLLPPSQPTLKFPLLHTNVIQVLNHQVDGSTAELGVFMTTSSHYSVSASPRWTPRFHSIYESLG